MQHVNGNMSLLACMVQRKSSQVKADEKTSDTYVNPIPHERAAMKK